MVGYSKDRPEEIVPCEGGWQFRYNITELAASESQDSGYSYDYVMVPAVDRATLIDALITEKFSYAAQLGKLALSRTSAEWTAYNTFRQECYTTVDAALSRRTS